MFNEGVQAFKTKVLGCYDGVKEVLMILKKNPKL